VTNAQSTDRAASSQLGRQSLLIHWLTHSGLSKHRFGARIFNRAMSPLERSERLAGHSPVKKADERRKMRRPEILRSSQSRVLK
jgi:hypothetical protein